MLNRVSPACTVWVPGVVGEALNSGVLVALGDWVATAVTPTAVSIDKGVATAVVVISGAASGRINSRNSKNADTAAITTTPIPIKIIEPRRMIGKFT